MGEKIQWIYNSLQNVIVFVSLLYAIINWRKIKQNGYLKLFPLYIAISLVISLFWFFKKIQFPGILIQNIFIPFEFFIFYNFFIKVLKNKQFYIILITLSILFALSIIAVPTFLYTNQNLHKNIISFLKYNGLFESIVIENILIVIPILLYYMSLFNRPYIKNLSTDSIFLAMTGILFCFALPIPVYVLKSIITSYNRQLYLYLYIINSIAYIGMHLFFIKAFKCIK
jgi:hypothetical protein